ncbi:transcriptional regulator, IclR family [Shimia gijangensis]|uniref:Transcriptional regulator, IclR family n=1 Tax=Shimia gijangensis TaxID=1470563 RepID=A0A1M6SUC8_9RHOB|nr:IclR family transcriptional regulator C-terminal domain-containing protein [Shimia gijangensis]SHK48331.1 transcriptional regulator, IclR family [Shimia gijangensis]
MTFKNVRALERGLEVLLIVNQKNAASIKDITSLTDIPRPTIYRLLDTLETQGYIVKSTTDDRWHAALKSKALSSGFRDEDWVARHAVPHMIDLGNRILWPVDLVTFQNFEMVVRESTHSLSPFSIDHGVVGQSLPLLETSGGRCYLAFCNDTERTMILDGLKKSGRMTEGYFQSELNLDYMLGQIRALGLGFRREGFREHTMSLSAPIWSENRVIACLTIIIIASAMSFEAVLEKHAEDLKETASKISVEMPTLAKTSL